MRSNHEKRNCWKREIMGKNSEEQTFLLKELKKLKKHGNEIFDEHITAYGQLRGFKKPVGILLQDELDGGDFRELNAIETNTYKMPR
jgi:hypothetical protein